MRLPKLTLALALGTAALASVLATQPTSAWVAHGGGYHPAYHHPYHPYHPYHPAYRPPPPHYYHNDTGAFVGGMVAGAVAGAAVGAAAAAPKYPYPAYGYPPYCGYAPYPPCAPN